MASITIAPTWKGLLPLLLAIYKDGDEEGRKAALEELRRMADAADVACAASKAFRE